MADGAAVDGPMAAALAADRERWNGLFQQARRRHPTLDGDDFARALGRLGRPVVDAAEAAVPGSAAPVTAVAYEVLLELAGRNLTADPAVVGSWRDLFPLLARVIGTDPAGVLGPLTNAAWNLAATIGPRPADWSALMAVVGAQPVVDGPTIRTAGLLAAWRSGLAHARHAALDAARALPAEVAAAALGLAAGTDPGPVVARLSADRWTGLDDAPRSLRLAARVGSFRGFGGPFPTPPRVGTDGAGLLVRSGPADPVHNDFWDLHADRFGATLTRRGAPEVEPIHPPPGTGVRVDGTVSLGPSSVVVPEAADPVSWAATTDTVVVTTSRTYSILVLAEIG